MVGAIDPAFVHDGIVEGLVAGCRLVGKDIKAGSNAVVPDASGERFLIDELDLTRKRRADVVDRTAAAWILQGALDRLRD